MSLKFHSSAVFLLPPSVLPLFCPAPSSFHFFYLQRPHWNLQSYRLCCTYPLNSIPSTPQATYLPGSTRRPHHLLVDSSLRFQSLPSLCLLPSLMPSPLLLASKDPETHSCVRALCRLTFAGILHESLPASSWRGSIGGCVDRAAPAPGILGPLPWEQDSALERNDLCSRKLWLPHFHPMPSLPPPSSRLSQWASSCFFPSQSFLVWLVPVYRNAPHSFLTYSKTDTDN